MNKYGMKSSEFIISQQSLRFAASFTQDKSLKPKPPYEIGLQTLNQETVTSLNITTPYKVSNAFLMIFNHTLDQHTPPS